MRNAFPPFTCLACLMLVCIPFWGCRSVPPPVRENEVERGEGRGIGVPRSEPRVVAHFPKESQHFSTCQKINPIWWFRNADEPVAPEGYRPGECCRNFRYHVRNPCHNFFFYVMGIVDKPFTRVGRFPESIGNPNGGWNWAVCRYKRLRLPFVDYKHGRFEFYWGWREGGAFGIKLNFAQKLDAPVQKPSEGGPSAE